MSTNSFGAIRPLRLQLPFRNDRGFIEYADNVGIKQYWDDTPSLMGSSDTYYARVQIHDLWWQTVANQHSAGSLSSPVRMPSARPAGVIPPIITDEMRGETIGFVGKALDINGNQIDVHENLAIVHDTVTDERSQGSSVISQVMLNNLWWKHVGSKRGGVVSAPITMRGDSRHASLE